jgi:protoheme IX farnesyltransferase
MSQHKAIAIGGEVAQTTTAAPQTIAAADLIALVKPRITLLVLSTTATGLWMAPGTVHPARALLSLLGVALLVSGANALNMYLERDVDALMERTRQRPLPAGRLHPEIAFALGVALGAFAVPLLALSVNRLTGVLGLLSFLLYVCAYTPLKQRSTWALVVGAIPGAMPPLMGWTAATGSLAAPGLSLFSILFLWQLPHFIAISLVRADEYARAGIQVVPIVHGVDRAKRLILLYSFGQFAASLSLARLGIGGRFYVGAAFALGAVQLALAGYGVGIRSDAAARTRRWARSFFLYSLIYLPVLFGALLIGRG